jgi:two-component system, NtrC family, sensor histidine kinase GlrK
MFPILRHLTLTHRWLLVIVSAILPLTLAFVITAYYLKQKFDSPRKIAELVNYSNQLSHNMEELERAARLYARIGDQTHLDIFQVKRQTFEDNLIDLKTRIDTANITLLQTQLTKLNQLFNTADPRSLSDEAIKALFANDLSSPFGQAKNSLDQLIQDIYQRLDQGYARVVTYVVVIFVITLPITLLLVFLASLAITRPIDRLSKAIHRLGDGNWEQPVRIYGPPELETLGRRLEETRQCLAVIEQQKQTFLTHITHELKTPLAAIKEAGSLLKDQVPGAINQEQRNVLNILLSNAENLMILIQQLLNYNAARHHRMTTVAKVDLPSMCEKIRQKIMEARPHSQCRWVISGHPNQIATDLQGTEMILSNLMGNAHDFAPEQGFVEVHWGQTDTHWWLSVNDNGPGIREEEQHQIFKPFYQGKTSRRGPLKGTGVGLAIVQECVTQMQGQITLSSTPLGSCFTVTCPVLNP